MSKFLAGQPDLLQSLCSTRQLSLTVAVWVKVINELKNTLAAEGVFWKGTISVECNNLSLNLEGIFSHAPDMCIHKNIIGLASPWMVWGLILPPTRICLTEPPMSLSTLELLVWRVWCHGHSKLLWWLVRYPTDQDLDTPGGRRENNARETILVSVPRDMKSF